MSALPASLEDKYTLASGRAYMTGVQALVRLAMIQRTRDLAAGLNTAGFISGYRGSPLGGFDQTLWKAKGHLKEHHIYGHIERKGVAVLDMTGLAQKGGSVYSHIRIAERPDKIHAVRIAAGDARLVIGCNMVVSASDEAIAKMQAGFTRAAVKERNLRDAKTREAQLLEKWRNPQAAAMRIPIEVAA